MAGGKHRARQRASEASLAERLAIRRGIFTAIDGIVDGFLARLERADFELASSRDLVRQRFGPGQVVLGEALAAAFPQYARLAAASMGDPETLAPGKVVPVRNAEHTGRDPYRTIDYDIDQGVFEGEITHGLVESIVLTEALDCYNEIVGMFHAGSADEVHELENIRRSFQMRYRDLVSLDELDANRPPAPAEEPGADDEESALSAFFAFLFS